VGSGEPTSVVAVGSELSRVISVIGVGTILALMSIMVSLGRIGVWMGILEASRCLWKSDSGIFLIIVFLSRDCVKIDN